MPDNSPSQPTEPTNSGNQPTAKHPPGNNVGLLQAYQLRNLAAKEALALADCPLAEDETRSARAQALSALVRAWETAAVTEWLKLNELDEDSRELPFVITLSAH